MAVQELSTNTTGLAGRLTMLAIGASLALAAWGTSGVVAGSGKTEALSATSHAAAPVLSCPSTSVPAINDVVEPPRGPRF